ALLADTAGLQVVGQITQNLTAPNPKTFIGSGKVEEVIALAKDTAADLIIFDDELNPRHQRELERIVSDDIRVIDRTALILDIFAQHASTREGSLQVELAQYEYRLPRLTRAWTHLARQAGGGSGRAGVGGVGLRGPGETQLEVDRREINRRIDQLKSELEKVRAHRQRYRTKRKKSQLPIVALVGYTNAGKSTLLNQLSEADVYVADKLFATLDPTTRRVELPDGNIVLFTDTVGFIQKLPTSLIAAFQATLEEIGEADLLLHIMDITHPNVRSHARAVHDTLSEIEADHIPEVSVLNKVDRLADHQSAIQALSGFPNAVAISALHGIGIDKLLEKVMSKLYESHKEISVYLPYSEGKMINLFHEEGIVDEVAHVDGGVQIRGRIPGRIEALFNAYQKKNPEKPN
ncbi:MAG: GTPase HflX, partial [candidate division Zixibacteria bacterium]|nr:GTPase HflX [candidate division Zixibacteria bacterium]NIR65190.1 GTPase HflX [candidate division Zixibacteria bacterium]NIS46920.1 GTPase HflX [candidate division Zixibacteria bacterium]NIT51309.1 GTPase HflX [candidate division Zixibacteria bacterium]NIU15066.1 GTPase HflX [candidate division Zixibacteria bacterium]